MLSESQNRFFKLEAAAVREVYATAGFSSEFKDNFNGINAGDQIVLSAREPMTPSKNEDVFGYAVKGQPLYFIGWITEEKEVVFWVYDPEVDDSYILGSDYWVISAA